tara:strand:- start:926 stop:1357 length:432 start_codon:yes stop_codon:yes gene_type:complete
MAKGLFFKDKLNETSIFRVVENESDIPEGVKKEQYHILDITSEQYNQIMANTHLAKYDENLNVEMIETPCDWPTKEAFARRLDGEIERRSRPPLQEHKQCLEKLRDSHELNNFEFPNTKQWSEMCAERGITWVGEMNLFNESN